MTELVTMTKVGVEFCIKYLAPTENLRKGIERQGNILNLVSENAQYYEQEVRNQLEAMQEKLEMTRVQVANGRSSVGWKYFFRNLSCIKRARAFASLTSRNLVEVQTLSIQAKRQYEKERIISSQSLSITLDNVELSKGTTSLNLPVPLDQDYLVSATINLRPVAESNQNVTMPTRAQSVTVNGTVDVVEHSLSEDSNTQGRPDVEVVFRDVTCTITA